MGPSSRPWALRPQADARAFWHVRRPHRDRGGEQGFTATPMYLQTVGRD